MLSRLLQGFKTILKGELLALIILLVFSGLVYLISNAL
jgi:hypothetical protein